MSEPVNWLPLIKKVSEEILRAETDMRCRGCCTFAEYKSLVWGPFNGGRYRILLDGKPLQDHKSEVRLLYSSHLGGLKDAADVAMRKLVENAAKGRNS